MNDTTYFDSHGGPLKEALDKANAKVSELEAKNSALTTAAHTAYDALNECSPLVDHALVLPAMEAIRETIENAGETL